MRKDLVGPKLKREQYDSYGSTFFTKLTTTGYTYLVIQKGAEGNGGGDNRKKEQHGGAGNQREDPCFPATPKRGRIQQGPKEPATKGFTKT